uniref:C2 domain-containing protein n=1 Tax=Anthurium amnicola TaxID=1678845 RepID=A0A1D1XQY6_9ARAE
MDSFKVAEGFRFRGRSSPEPMGEEAEGAAFSGLLEVHIHHARNIHNICIYDNQDVYAKFSLTCSPDETLSTRVVPGGGRNPDFDETLRIEVANPDAVLKCEIWMLSRVRSYLEDQLLGFALVPLSSISSGDAGETTHDFTLSSTDLFHSPAGTVRLTLSMATSAPPGPSGKPFAGGSISSEVVLFDPVEYVRIEFPDIGATREDQQMVSHYFTMAEQSSPSRPGGVPFLQLGAASQSVEDYDMAANSPDGSIQNSGIFGSTTTSLGDDSNSADSSEKKGPECANGSHPAVTQSSETPPETPTSKFGAAAGGNREESVSTQGEAEGAVAEMESSVFKSPLGSINLEEEQSAMQQQIVDMYMRSMQQFTESLAKMKLPMDLDRPNKEQDGGDVIQGRSSHLDKEAKKKDGSRVFYGSRAFF